MHFPAPVVDGAELLHRALQFFDPLISEDSRVTAGLDGGVLGRQTEGVKPKGGKDGFTQHRLVANDEVSEGVVADVSLVGRSRGVRVHAKGVEALARIVIVDFVETRLTPPLLPLAFQLHNIKRACHEAILRSISTRFTH